MKIYYVYTHYRYDKNEYFYVGIGKEDIKNNLLIYRRANEKKKSRNNHWKSIVNINPDYRIDIVYESYNPNDVKTEEIRLIKLYGRKDLGLGTLVNMTDGGDGQINPSEETLIKMRKHKSDTSKMGKHNKCGNKNPMFNKTIYSQWTSKYGKEIADEKFKEYLKNLSKSLKGRTPWNKDKKLTEDQRNSIILGIEKHKKICNICNMLVDSANYQRFHGINCNKAEVIKKKDLILKMKLDGNSILYISTTLGIKYGLIKYILTKNLLNE